MTRFRYSRTAHNGATVDPLLPSIPTLLLLLALALAVALMLSPAARAEGCDQTGAAQVEIAQVTDELDILLKDERSVRLAGIKMLSSGTEQEAETKPVNLVKEMVANGAVSVRVLAPIADRWGRLAADLFIGNQNLQAALVGKGLAVARPDDLRSPCWQSIRAAETQARHDNAGFWASPDAILKATDNAKLVARDGLFSLASGEVRHVSRRKSRSFVDLGPFGSNALFLMIDNRALTRMEKLGFKLEQLTGRKILVRGVVLNGRSPHMVIDDLDAIEFWD
jgi:endonuclease YncB( thermonuclease family)